MIILLLFAHESKIMPTRVRLKMIHVSCCSQVFAQVGHELASGGCFSCFGCSLVRYEIMYSLQQPSIKGRGCHSVDQRLEGRVREKFSNLKRRPHFIRSNVHPFLADYLSDCIGGNYLNPWVIIFLHTPGDHVICARVLRH